MTVLLLKRQTLASLKRQRARAITLTAPVGIFAERMSSRGVMLFMIGFVVLGCVLYLSALNYSFGIGYDIQQETERAERLAAEVLKVEMRLQNRTSLLAGDSDILIQSMEKVTAVKYVLPENVVTARSFR